MPMGDAIDGLTFDDNPFAGALDDLKAQMDQDFGSATASLRTDADQIMARLKSICDLQSSAAANQADLTAQTQAVKADLAQFENRFGSLGQQVGNLIKS